MIIINLKGGLGNQMFQYAFGRAYSIKYGDEMKLDISGYSKQSLRSYNLHVFNIKEIIADDDEIHRIKYPYGILSKIWRGFSQKILRRHYLDYHPSLFKPKKDMYFDGFFQSEKYFLEYTEILKREFILLKDLSPEAMKIRLKIEESSVPISLHIRRGDYMSNKKVLALHGVCPLTYYEKAVETITNGYPEATFYVFSDDVAWVKENLKVAYPIIYVSQSGISDAEELILMSKCCNHIIANSSFSWWGAWLGYNPEKIVIAPKKWTNKVPENHPNIIPSSWTRI